MIAKGTPESRICGFRLPIGFSIHHVYYELACPEFLLQVHEAAKLMGVDVLAAPVPRKHEAFHLTAGAASRLVPDGMVLLRTRRRGMICTVVEIDTGSMLMHVVVDKLRRYSAWSQSDQGHTFVSDLYRKHAAVNPQPRFRVAVICRDSHCADGNRRLQALVGAADQLPPAIRRFCWLTTARPFVMPKTCWRPQSGVELTEMSVARWRRMPFCNDDRTLHTHADYESACRCLQRICTQRVRESDHGGLHAGLH